MKEARSEIKHLRRWNEIYGAKLEVFDVFAPVVRMLVSPRGGMACSEDVVGKLDAAIEKLSPPAPTGPIQAETVSHPDRSPVKVPATPPPAKVKRKWTRRTPAAAAPEKTEPAPVKKKAKPVANLAVVMGEKPDTLGGAMKVVCKQLKKFTLSDLLGALRADADFNALLEEKGEGAPYANIAYWAKTGKLNKSGEGAEAVYTVVDLDF